MSKKSILIFSSGIVKRWYFCTSVAIFTPIKIYEYFIKDELPKNYQFDLVIPIMWIFIIFFVIFFIATIQTFNEYREKLDEEKGDILKTRLNELYSIDLEAKKDKVHRIFFNLHQRGKLLESANLKDKQQWDEEVLKKITEYCRPEFKNHYLVKTSRMVGSITPLENEKYTTALSIVKHFIDNDIDIWISA